MPSTEAVLQVFRGPGKGFELRSLPLPEPAAGEVLVRLDLATICGSDLYTVRGGRPQPVPAVLGHEGVGTVVVAGRGRDLEVGTRVTWSLVDRCGSCAFCTRYGLPEKCESLFKYGHASLAEGGASGCYASHILLRPGTEVVAVPEGLSDTAVAPANCVLATAVNVVSQLSPSCESFVVQGAGLLGLYLCALLRKRGVGHLFCCDPDDKRLELAPSFGAIPLGADPGEREAEVRDRCPHGVDAVIEAAGDPAVVPEGVDLVRTGGWLILAGMVHPRSALPLTGERIIRKCLTLRGVHNYSPRHLREAVRFLEETAAVHPYERLVSPSLYPLPRLEEAFAAAECREWHRIAVRPGES